MDHKNFNQTDAMVSYFETGEKEGLLLNSVYPEEEKHIDRLIEKGYIYTNFKEESFIFFNKKEDLDTFNRECFPFIGKGLDKEVSDIIGILLGFPPIASKEYKKRVKEGTSHINLFLNWNGMYFASYKETLIDDFCWLNENKPLKDNGFVIIERELYLTSDKNWKKEVLKRLIFYIEKGIDLKAKKTEKRMKRLGLLEVD